MNDKQRVAMQAVQYVKDGMVVGLGTGSTADFFIEELAKRRNVENLQIQVVASSVISAVKAQQLGLPLLGIEQLVYLDLYVDGADEVAPDMTLLKGRGADLVREKLLAKASKMFLVLIDASKRVERIGINLPIPIEVMPFAWQVVKRSIENIGGWGDLRLNAKRDNVAVTAYGSLVLDMAFTADKDAATLDAELNAIPGIVEHGIFSGLASAVFCACPEGVEEQWR
ncbi:MAG: ribose-5-phosphate isomerase RpiA [Methylobacter sp.]